MGRSFDVENAMRQPPPADDTLNTSATRIARSWAGLALAVIVLAAITAIVLSDDLLPYAAIVLFPGALSGLRLLRHPERATQVDAGRLQKAVIARGGLDLASQDLTSNAEERLALLDSLDAIRKSVGSRRAALWGRVAGSVGALGWWVGAGAAWVIAHDVAGTVVCAAMGGLFAALRWYIGHTQRRSQEAIALLETQLASIERKTRRADEAHACGMLGEDPPI